MKKSIKKKLYLSRETLLKVAGTEPVEAGKVSVMTRWDESTCQIGALKAPPGPPG